MRSYGSVQGIIEADTSCFQQRNTGGYGSEDRSGLRSDHAQLMAM